MNILLEFILTAIPIGMTLLFGCVGEILTEKAGHLNLGIPGIMCMGGSCGCLALVVMNNALPPALIVTISILAGFLGGVLMGVLYCFLTVTLKANQNVTGLAMTIFGAGTTKFILMKLAVDDGMKYLYAKDYFRFPFHESTSSLMYCGVMTYLDSHCEGTASLSDIVAVYDLFEDVVETMLLNLSAMVITVSSKSDAIHLRIQAGCKDLIEALPAFTLLGDAVRCVIQDEDVIIDATLARGGAQ